MALNVQEIEELSPEILEEADRRILLRYVRPSSVERARLSWREERALADRLELSQALESKLRCSPLGPFLRHLNRGQEASEEVNRAKLDVAAADMEAWPAHWRASDLHDDGTLPKMKARMKALLEEAILDARPTGIVTEGRVLRLMKTLRLQHCHITNMDASISDLDNLEAVILSGNYLSDFGGALIPRNVKFLELYANFIAKIVRLKNDLPPNLLYLGLGDNCLTNQSKIEDLCCHRCLCFLNLADNDIEDLIQLLAHLQNIHSLRSLVLHGNPCSVMVSYRSIVHSYLPRVLFLDGVNLANSEEQQPTNPANDTSAVLQIFGFRIMGVPKPKPKSVKGKKVEQGYQLGVECPLLDQNLRRYEATEIANRLAGLQLPLSELKQKSRKGRRDGKEKSKSGKQEEAVKERTEEDRGKSGGTSRDKKGKNKEKEEKRLVNAAYKKFLEDDKEIEGGTTFKSKRVPWAEIMSFKQPTIEIPVTETKLKQLRDTLRSLLTMRIVLMTTMPPEKKKEKEKLKSSPKKNIIEKGAEHSPNVWIENKNLPEETVLLRQTIAKIPVPSEIICWSEPYLGYVWDMSKPNFALSYPGIKDVQFGIDKKKKKGK